MGQADLVWRGKRITLRIEHSRAEHTPGGGRRFVVNGEELKGERDALTGASKLVIDHETLKDKNTVTVIGSLN